MYVLLEKNKVKDGYVFKVAETGFNTIVKFAVLLKLSVIEGEDLQDLCDLLAKKPIKSMPLLLGGKDERLSIIPVNRPADETESGVGSLRKLKSLTVVNSNKNGKYMVFAEVATDNTVFAQPRLYYHIMYSMLKQSPGFEDCVSLELRSINITPCLFATVNTAFLEPQLGVCMMDDGSYKQVYTYGLGYELIESEKTMQTINFHSDSFYYDRTFRNCQADDPAFSNIEIFQKLKELFTNKKVNLDVKYYDTEIDFPMITGMRFHFSDFMDNMDVIRAASILIHDYNLAALDENKQLTIRDYGYKNLSVAQIDKDRNLKELRLFLSNIKIMSTPWNGFEEYHKQLCKGI